MAIISLHLCALRAHGDALLATPIYYFNNQNDGANPQAGLIQATSGIMYGTTTGGGSNFEGTIFQVTPGHVVTPIYSFTGTTTDGGTPLAPVMQASDGNLYGTTSTGGASSFYGTVFRISTNRVFQLLYSFTGNNDGGNPQAGLVQANDGLLYGTTYNGGSNSLGTVFRISTNGAFKSFYSFASSADGSSPLNLVKGADNNLYGVTFSGGSTGSGTIFRVKTNATVATLYSFLGGTDGAYPEGLTAGAGGNFYGTTYQAGSNNLGGVFKYNTNGSISSFYSFTGGTDGANPRASLMQTGNGTLYGTVYFDGDTFAGGTGTNHGAIFQITSNGLFSNLYSFSGTNDGADPYGGLLLASDGTFYGVTQYGGKPGFGTVDNFQLFTSPTNDNFANRSQLVGLGQGYNVGATSESKEPASGGGQASVNNTVWWTWTAPTNGPVSVLTAGSSFDTIIDVYTGTVLSNLVCIASNLTTVLDYELNPNLVANAGVSNRVNFTATAGTHYQFQVSGLSSGTIAIAAQTTAIKVLSVTPLATNSDGSIPFNASVQVGNSGLFTPGQLQVEVLAHAGSSYNTEPPDGPPNSSLIPPDQVLTNYTFTNPITVAPGTTTNINISGICPGPTVMKEFPSDPTNTLGFGWGVFVVLNEKFDTNWFFDDNALVFYGQWPVVSTNPGPQAGVIRLNPGVSGSTPVFQSAQINGPTVVNQKSANNYSGTANFVNGTTVIPVNFTNTFWSASSFTITNGLFQTGPVVTNTPVTLTTLYSYDYYGVSITNTNQLSVLVLRSSSPSLSSTSYQTNHNFAFTLNSLPSSKFILQGATNLKAPVTWVPLSTNTTDTNGIWSFVDTGTTNRPLRYYRAMQTQ